MSLYCLKQTALGFACAIVIVVIAASYANDHPVAVAITVPATVILTMQLLKAAQTLDNTREGVKVMADQFDKKITGPPVQNRREGLDL